MAEIDLAAGLARALASSWGTTPEVDSVIRRRDSEMPSGSMTIFIASRTFSKL